MFSELAIVITGQTLTHLPWDVALFKTLRKMNEIRPFKLEFMPEASDFHQQKVRRELAGALDLVKAQGFLDFSTPYPRAVGRDLPLVDGTRPSPTLARYNLTLPGCNLQRGVRLERITSIGEKSCNAGGRHGI